MLGNCQEFLFAIADLSNYDRYAICSSYLYLRGQEEYRAMPRPAKENLLGYVTALLHFRQQPVGTKTHA